MAKSKRVPKKRPAKPASRLRITKVYTRHGDAGMTRLVGGQEVKKSSARIEAYGTVDELSVAIGCAREEIEWLIDDIHERAITHENASAMLEEMVDRIVEDRGGAKEGLKGLFGRAKKKARGAKAKDGAEIIELEHDEESSDEVDDDEAFAGDEEDVVFEVDTGALELLSDHLLYLQNLLFTLGGDLATRVADRWADMPLVGKSDIDYLEKLIDGYNSALPPLEEFILPGGGPAPLAIHSCRVVCRRAERQTQRLAEEESIGEFVLPFLNRLSDSFFVMARWVLAEQLHHDMGEREMTWNRKLKRPSPPKPEA